MWIYSVYYMIEHRCSTSVRVGYRCKDYFRFSKTNDCHTVWFSLTKTKTKMVKNEKITNSLTKTKTKTKKMMKTKTKLKRKNRKRLKTKTKMPKQHNLSLNKHSVWRLRVLRPYCVESVTNGGRYLSRSSTGLRQQVWYYLVVGKTKTKK